MNIISNKKNLMFALLFVLIIILSLRLTIIGTKQTHLPLKYKSSDRNILPKETKYQNLNLPELKLQQLNKPKIKYQENTKNIFKSIIIPPIKYTPPPPVVLHPPAPPAPRRNPLEEELKKIQFIGFSENKGKMSVFLSKGDNLFVVGKGEKIEDKFLVKDITQNDIILTIMNQTDIEFKINLKDDYEGSNPGYGEQPPSISYQEIEEPQIIEEPFPIPEEPPESPPVQPDTDPMHRRPMPPGMDKFAPE